MYKATPKEWARTTSAFLLFFFGIDLRTLKEGILGFRKILTSSMFLIGSETHVHQAL